MSLYLVTEKENINSKKNKAGETAVFASRVKHKLKIHIKYGRIEKMKDIEKVLKNREDFHGKL